MKFIKSHVEFLKIWLESKKNRERLKLISKRIVSSFFLSVIIIIFLFLLFRLQFNLTFPIATWLSLTIGIYLAVGLSISKGFRCVCMLTLPQLFSRTGRSAMIGYAFIVALTGPGTNFSNNIEVLSESMTCGQQQLSNVVKGVVDLVKQPYIAIKNTVKHILKNLRHTLAKIREILIHMKNLIGNTLTSIKKSFTWLSDIVNICNKKIGTPFDRCHRVLDETVSDCKSQLGFMDFVCDTTQIGKLICYNLKFMDLLCSVLSFVNDSIIGTVQRELEKFMDEIQKIFFVSVHFDHTFYFRTQASKNFSQIHEEIVNEVKNRSRSLFLVFSVLEVFSMALVLLFVFRAFYYKQKYMTNDRFDNHFLTRDFDEIDAQRKSMGIDSVLPLSRREKWKYIRLKSFQLVWKEKLKITRSAFFMFVSTIQLATIIFADYGLYWVLYLITHTGEQEDDIEIPPAMTLTVHGEGLLADMYRGIFDAFHPFTQKYNIDPIVCLPKPNRPNFDRYLQIGSIIICCWIFLVFEPYGLRLRQVVMSGYYPQRSRERALVLYNNILRKRSGFLKIARRQLRQKFVKDKSGAPEKSIGYLDYLRAKFNHLRVMRWILGKGGKEIFCALCGRKMAEEMIECLRPGCSGKYCSDCFNELNNRCTICLEPIDYGDLSDVSEEKDSTDDETPQHIIHPIRGVYRRTSVQKFNLFKLNKDDVEMGAPSDDDYIFEILHGSEDGER